MTRSIFLTALVLFAAQAAFTQFPQMQKAQQRMDQLRKADEAEQKAREAEDLAAVSIPRPKPSVMNRNIQTVLTTKEYKTFAEAKPFAAKRIADGDQLWAYVKFDTKLGDYVLTLKDAENGGQFKYVLFAEVGPKADVTALSRYVLEFTKEDLALSEIKVNLAPGKPGRNAAVPVFIDVAGTRGPGIWNNEFRLTNTVVVPRSLTDNLATADMTMNFVGVVTKYPKAREDFSSMVLRGTTDKATLPVAGSFYSLPLKTEILDRLKTDSITPVRFYYASNGWLEYGMSVTQPARLREVTAVFTYRNGESCNYGVARLVQSFDAMADTFATSAIELTKDLPLACTNIE